MGFFMKVFFTKKAKGRFVLSTIASKIIGLFFFAIIFIDYSCYSQQFVSPAISPNFIIQSINDRVIVVSNELDLQNRKRIYYFNGNIWSSIQSSEGPDLKFLEPNVLLSQYSNSVFIPFKEFLWEYNQGQWKKHFVPDTFQNNRSFLDIVELPDSSFLISTIVYVSYFSGNQYVEYRQNELFTYKNGEFTIPKLKRIAINSSNNFSSMKKYPNGNYSYYTNLYSGNDSIWEFVLFDEKENPISQFSLPLLDEQYVNAQVKITDYLFDSKGSIWFLTASKREFLLDSNGNKVLDTSGFVVFTHNFPGLIEVDSNNQIKYYNNNIGLDSSVYESLSFDIDKNDNIWFIYNHRFSFPDNHYLPSLYKLEADRSTIREYSIETILKNSKIYNGGKQNEKFDFDYLHKKLKINNHTSSIYIVTSKPLIEFFPEWIPTSILETNITPILLYPNPVQSNSFVILESDVFENVDNQLLVIIRDINGAVAKEETTSSIGNKLHINIEELRKGAYFIAVIKNKNTILQTRFIKE